jgi:hypothetical protein
MTYDSFGKLTASTGTVTNSFQLTGREFDQETGSYYYGALYFGLPLLDHQDLPIQPNIAGSAGARALAAGADVYEIPMGSTALPRVLGGFQPR